MNPDARTALVTGAARGIGLAIARRLAGDGARVTFLDVDRERVEAAARDVGGDAVALTADTRSAEGGAVEDSEKWPASGEKSLGIKSKTLRSALDATGLESDLTAVKVAEWVLSGALRPKKIVETLNVVAAGTA